MAHVAMEGEWRTVRRLPASVLRAYVHGYVGSTSLLRHPVRELHMPSIEVPLLLNFGEPHRRLGPQGSQDWTSKDGAWVVGVHERRQVTEALGAREFMVVRFSPIGAHLFLRTPMNLIADEALDLELIDAALARALKDRVGRQCTWVARFAAMDALISERIVAMPKPAAMTAAWNRLTAADGQVRIATLAQDMGCSRRVLATRFHAHVGTSPKLAARLMRFGRVLSMCRVRTDTTSEKHSNEPFLEAREPRRTLRKNIPWAAIAVECGYFDQAHFIREFEAFAGETPTAFLRRAAA